MEMELPLLHDHLQENNVMLEPLLASPFFTLFTNVVDIDSSLCIIERFMLLGESYILDTIIHILKGYTDKLMKLESMELQ